MILATFIQSLLALSSAMAGAVLALAVGASHRNLCALISLAAGTLLATTFMDIIPEAWGSTSALAVAIALGSGYLLFALLSRFVFHVCPACAASHFDDHTSSEFRNIAVLLGVAFGIHSAMDGVAIALGNEFGKITELSIFLTVTAHKFPEGLALCGLLLGSGAQKPKALLLTLAFEVTTLLGWFLGTFAIRGSLFNQWFPLILLHIGGGFVYLALHAILGERKKHPSKLIFTWCMIGIVIILLARAFPFHE